MWRRVAFLSLAGAAACSTFAASDAPVDGADAGSDASDDVRAAPDAPSDEAAACVRKPFDDGFDVEAASPAALWSSSATQSGTFAFSPINQGGTASLEVSFPSTNSTHTVYLEKTVERTDCPIHVSFAFRPESNVGTMEIFSIETDDGSFDAGASGAILLQIVSARLEVFDQRDAKGYQPKQIGTLTPGVFATIDVDYDPKRSPQTRVTFGGSTVDYEGLSSHGPPKSIRLGCVYASNSQPAMKTWFDTVALR
jgi:hypothetical protein